MKRLRFALILLTTFTLASCGGSDDDSPAVIIDPVAELEKPTATTTLSLSNMPVIDGSDSTEPLRSLLVYRLLGINCQWLQNLHTNATWTIKPIWDELDADARTELQRILMNRNTHGSFVSLIDGEDDLIITARGVSRDEQKYADEKGVALTSYPIAKDAFVFIVNPKNPVRNLTIEQIQKIYTGEIRNWKEVGGNDATINPYILAVRKRWRPSSWLDSR